MNELVYTDYDIFQPENGGGCTVTLRYLDYDEEMAFNTRIMPLSAAFSARLLQMAQAQDSLKEVGSDFADVAQMLSKIETPEMDKISAYQRELFFRHVVEIKDFKAKKLLSNGDLKEEALETAAAKELIWRKFPDLRKEITERLLQPIKEENKKKLRTSPEPSLTQTLN